MYAQVIVDIAHSQVDRIFEYSCEDGTPAGSRVKVPFGGRTVDGFIVGLSRTSAYPAEKVKPVSFVYEEPPALVPECFSLMNELSERHRLGHAVAGGEFVHQGEALFAEGGRFVVDVCHGLDFFGREGAVR